MQRFAAPALALLTLALPSGAPIGLGIAQVPAAPAMAMQPAPITGPLAAQNGAGDAAPVPKLPAARHAPQLASRAAKVQHGLASWYGQAFDGQRTASGKTFDMHALTAAHPRLPLGSYARVTLLRTGRSVVVHITDRGPFKSHRIIDVSRAAAAKLGLLRRGVGEVAVQPVARPDQIASAN
jgi:rare lipoprotein A